LAETLKLEAGTIVHVPPEPRFSAPFESRFQLDTPETAGEILKIRPAVGVTLFDAALSAPYPTRFCAATVNVYAVPFVNPVIVMGDAEPVAVTPPGLDVTRYPVIGDPPSLAGAVNVTDAVALVEDVAVPIVGAPGTVTGVGQLLPIMASRTSIRFQRP
jgi:hypothetical protein